MASDARQFTATMWGTGGKRSIGGIAVSDESGNTINNSYGYGTFYHEARADGDIHQEQHELDSGELQLLDVGQHT